MPTVTPERKSISSTKLLEKFKVFVIFENENSLLGSQKSTYKLVMEFLVKSRVEPQFIKLVMEPAKYFYI